MAGKQANYTFAPVLSRVSGRLFHGVGVYERSIRLPMTIVNPKTFARTQLNSSVQCEIKKRLEYLMVTCLSIPGTDVFDVGI